MGTQSGRPHAPLAKLLFDEAFRFDFFQAVRLLERLMPERAPVGRTSGSNGAAAAGLPATEVVRFRTRQSLEFPASQIHQLVDLYAEKEDATLEEREAGAASSARDGEAKQRATIHTENTRNTSKRRAAAAARRQDLPPPPEMIVSFMGLTGPLGVLPSHYTELAQERARYKDTALWEFLDLFNHRLISLFYRAWEKYRFHIAYERGGDPVTEHLYDLIGMGTDGLKNRIGLPDEALLFYAGHLNTRPRAAIHVGLILSDYFRVPAQVEQFTGQWLPLDDDSLTRLGSANSDLGRTTIVGARVWDAQSKFRLRFGPLTFREFKSFLPTSTAFAPVGKLTRLLVGMEFDFDLELILKREEVPESRLDSSATGGLLLGWTSWLKTKEFAGSNPAIVLAVKE